MTSLKRLGIQAGLASALLCLPVLHATAGIISTEQAVDARSVPDTTSGARARLDALLSREDVARQLVAQGVDPAEAQRRLAGLSDSEVQALAGQIDRLPAGGAFASFTDQQLIIILLALILLALVL